MFLSQLIILVGDQTAKINVISNDFVNSNSDTRLQIPLFIIYVKPSCLIIPTVS